MPTERLIGIIQLAVSDEVIMLHTFSIWHATHDTNFVQGGEDLHTARVYDVYENATA